VPYLDALPRVATNTRALRATCWARLELCRVWLGAAAEGVNVGDTGDVDDGRGGMPQLRQRPPLPPSPIVLPGKVTTSQPVRRAIYRASPSSIRCCSHHIRMPRTPHAKSRRTRCWRRLCVHCATSTMVSHPALLAADSVPPPLENGQS
jgi:hypothetical protein